MDDESGESMEPMEEVPLSEKNKKSLKNKKQRQNTRSEQLKAG